VTNEEACAELEGELRKLLDPEDRLHVIFDLFDKDGMPAIFSKDDPETFMAMVMMRYSREIQGQLYVLHTRIDPQMLALSVLDIPTIAREITRNWERTRDEALRSGPPQVSEPSSITDLLALPEHRMTGRD
jgi:hypothetical protein